MIYSRCFITLKVNTILYTEFPEDLFEEDEIDDILSILLEYGYETPLTIHRIQEYGKEIIAENVFAEIRKHFEVSADFFIEIGIF